MIYGLLIFCFGASELKFSSDSVDIFHSNDIGALAWGEDFLIWEINDPGLSLIDQEGKLIRSYRKRGAGPGELEHAKVIGYSPKEIVVISNANQVISFDKNLMPNSEKYPRLPTNISQYMIRSGYKVGDRKFVVIFTGLEISNSHLMFEMLATEKDWQITRKFLPKKLAKATAEMPFPNALNTHIRNQGSILFKFRHAYLTSDDHYEVFALGKRKDFRPEIGLSADITDIKPIQPPFSCLVFTAAAYASGYVVEIQVKKDKWVHDFFSKDGAFVRRDYAVYRIKQLQNMPAYFKISENNDGQEMFELIR